MVWIRFETIMKTLKAPIHLLLLLPSIVAAENSAPAFDAAAADRFARLALACVDKEYPSSRPPFTAATTGIRLCMDIGCSSGW
jgi:hypothetical protein